MPELHPAVYFGLAIIWLLVLIAGAYWAGSYDGRRVRAWRPTRVEDAVYVEPEDRRVA